MVYTMQESGSKLQSKYNAPYKERAQKIGSRKTWLYFMWTIPFVKLSYLPLTLQTTGEVMKIQITYETRVLLDTLGGFYCVPRSLSDMCSNLSRCRMWLPWWWVCIEIAATGHSLNPGARWRWRARAWWTPSGWMGGSEGHLQGGLRATWRWWVVRAKLLALVAPFPIVSFCVP